MKETLKMKVISQAVFACLLWGSAFPVLKLMYKELSIESINLGDKILLAGMRFFVAGLLILIFYLIKKQSLPKIQSFTELKSFIYLGIFQTTILYIFFYQGIAYTTGVKSSILSQIGIFFVIILSYFVFHEKLTRYKAVGLLLGFIGIIALNLTAFTSQNGLFEFSFRGEGFLILSGLSSSLGTILAKKTTSKFDSIKTTGFQMLFGSIILLIIGVVVGSNILNSITPVALTLFIYSALLSATAFSIWFNLLKKYPAGTITIFKFLIPVFGSLLSITLLPGEEFTINILLSLTLVVLGIVYLNKK